MREPIEDVIRERVRALLSARPEVTLREFGEAVGRGYAWVHAFLAGTRHANEIHLLMKIARYFGVTVGYLLNESPRDLDAGAVTLLAAYDVLDERDRGLLRRLAASLRTNAEATAGVADDGRRERPKGGPEPPAQQKQRPRKERE